MERKKRLKLLLLGTFILSWLPNLIYGQEWLNILDRIYPFGSPSGYEHAIINEIKSLLPTGWSVRIDNLGSLIVFSGEKIEFLLASPVDEIGYFVSGLTCDGYIRIDRALNAPYRLFDNHLMGHGVIIWTKNGPIRGIVAQPAVHILTRDRREQLERGVSLDDIYIDVGARSDAEAKAKGIRILDAVTRERKLTLLGFRRLSGLALSDKLFPSLLISAISTIQNSAQTKGLSFAWVAQARVNARGVKGAQSLGLLNIKNRFPLKKAIILTGWPEDETKEGAKLGQGPVVIFAEPSPSALAESFIKLASAEKIELQVLSGKENSWLRPFQSEGVEAIILGVSIRDIFTPAETVSLNDVNNLFKLITFWIKRRPQ